MNSPAQYQISASQLQPGTVLKTRSTMYPVMHWGVVGYGKDAQGFPMVWHSQKSDTLRCTSYHEFCANQICEIDKFPQDAQQAFRIITRLRSKAGLPWHLTQANCEMVVRWAVEDKPVSHQLAFGAFAAIALVTVVAVAASGN